MSTELDVYTPGTARASLPAKVQYAHELANSGLLPSAYRRQPANVLYAVEYGDMLGLSPMAAITGIHIIEGKPTASAGLISALVRRAGHKLRVRGDGESATCQIIRSDDPEYTFEVTWTLQRNPDGNPSAEEAGLLGKQVWKQYGASMLKARAITQCARDACEEALFGLHYTPEELGAEVDEEGNVVGELVPEDKPARQAPASAQGGNGNVSEGTWRAHPAPEDEDPEWAAQVARMSTFATDDEGRELWAAIVTRWKTEKLIPEREAARLQGLIKARWKELKDAAEKDAAEPVDGVVVPDLDPADEWASAVEAIASTDDAVLLASEVSKQLQAGSLDDAKAAAIHAAIARREASLNGVAA